MRLPDGRLARIRTPLYVIVNEYWKGKIYRSNNPNAPLWNKAAITLIGNVLYSSRFLIYPFREMNNMPETLVPQVGCPRERFLAINSGSIPLRS